MALNNSKTPPVDCPHMKARNSLKILDNLLLPLPGPTQSVRNLTFAIDSVGPIALSEKSVPWVTIDDDDLLPYTRYAQSVISRAMIPQSGNCSQERILLQRFTSFGFGADIEMMSWSLLHAIHMKRILVFEHIWRWSLPGCKAWSCYWATPSPCDMDNATDTDLIRLKPKHNSSRFQKHRVMHKMFPNTQDYGFNIDAGLLPPNITKKQFLAMLPRGIDYNRWQLAQAIKYLTRYVQPWVRDLILDHVNDPQRASVLFPDGDTNHPTVGLHFRTGDTGKVVEFQNVFGGCGEFHIDLQATIADVMLERTNNLSRVNYFVSFDQPQTMWWMKSAYSIKRTNHVGNTHVEITHAGFEWPKRIIGEARNSLKATRGFGFVVKITLINLYLAVALPTAWVNNDHSSWSRVIHTIGMMAGKLPCAYVDLYRTWYDRGKYIRKVMMAFCTKVMDTVRREDFQCS
eukprot:PhF_6_TR4897/c0_g1_i2/m.6939